ILEAQCERDCDVFDYVGFQLTVKGDIGTSPVTCLRRVEPRETMRSNRQIRQWNRVAIAVQLARDTITVAVGAVAALEREPPLRPGVLLAEGDFEYLVTIFRTEREVDVRCENVVSDRQHEVYVEVGFGLYVRANIEISLEFTVDDAVGTQCRVPCVVEEELDGITAVARAEVVEKAIKQSAVHLPANSADDAGVVQFAAESGRITARHQLVQHPAIGRQCRERCVIYCNYIRVQRNSATTRSRAWQRRTVG